ncbi:MAG: alginate lyase family protein [Sulfurifustis sp.]
MRPSELAYRGWQEAAKQLDRVAVAAGGSHRFPRLYRQLTPELARAEVRARAKEGRLQAEWTLYDRFCAAAGERFFRGAGDERTPAVVAAQMPWARDRAVAAAEAVARKRFDLLGYRDLDFGDPIAWHVDPISGRAAPFTHWSRVDPLDVGQVGDSKVTWELNRHQWLVDLGQAYRYTGDERYAQLFAACVQDWMRANPPGMGINWTSSLEAALRLISWTWALFLFRGSAALTPALYANMLAWIGAHAEYIERYLSYYFSPNTHLTGEALGLFYAGVIFPELRGAARWRALGTRILLEQIDAQVWPDGVYFEQSTCYQRYTVEIYLHLLVLAARNAMAVPAAVPQCVQRMLDFLLAVRAPDGSMPQIGDADGGSLLPLARRAPDDFRGVFAAAAVFFHRADYAWAAQQPAPEMLWLLGADSLQIFAALTPMPSAASARLFPDGGYAVMRSGWDPRAHQLIFDVGPLGCRVSGGHGHADLLAIQCAVFGKPSLVDAGTYCYTADAGWRDYFRSSAAHSTVMVDGLSQADAAGPFRWRARPRARLRRWIATDAFDLADAEHDAYARLPDPVRHRRRVFFAKPRYWVVVDDLHGNADHRIDVCFQLAPIEAALHANQWARAGTPDGGALLIRSFASVPLTAALTQGATSPARGWVAPDYGRREPAPLLSYSATTRLPLRVVTLLLAVEDRAAPPAAVVDVAGGRIDLVFGDVRETVRIGDDDIAVSRRRRAAKNSANHEAPG